MSTSVQIAFGGQGHDAIFGGDAQDPDDPPERWDIDVLPVVRDRLYGGPGDDGIAGGKGPDTIYGEEGNDALEGWANRDWIYGGPGNDRIEGWSAGDFLWGDAGDDIISGGPSDTLAADDADLICGGPGDDRIDGWTGDDEIYGDRYGNDPLYGQGDGNDEIYGWEGDDFIYGGGGHDNLFGEEGDDELYGEDGDDLLKGRNDNDLGDPDDDFIDGGPGNNFLADTQTWPDDLPWPELNLVADVTADVTVDDRGPRWDSTWSYKGTEDPPPDKTPGYWFTEENSPAFGGSQSYLYADDLEGGDGLGDGDNASVWYAPVWTEQGDVYVSWVPRTDAATNAPFVVSTKDGVPLPDPDSHFLLNQTLWPDQQTLPGVIIDGRKYTHLGTFDVADGWLLVKVTDYGVVLGQSIVADVVLVKPAQLDPGSEVRPGSWANREENGFYGGLLLEMQDPNATWREVNVRVDGLIDPQTQENRLEGRRLKLEWEGDGTVIEVYSDPAMTPESRIYSGHTFDIGQLEYIYVKGVGAGSTELVLSLDPIPDDPLEGLRPISDIMAVAVNT